MKDVSGDVSPPRYPDSALYARSREQTGRRRRQEEGKETTGVPIKAETIQVLARWPTSGFETEALFAMHLRYTRERKRRGCEKGKGTKESRTNDVDNNDSGITNSGSLFV